MGFSALDKRCIALHEFACKNVALAWSYVVYELVSTEGGVICLHRLLRQGLNSHRQVFSGTRMPCRLEEKSYGKCWKRDSYGSMPYGCVKADSRGISGL